MVYRLELDGREFGAAVQSPSVVRWDTLLTLQQHVGEKQRFARHKEIYAEGSRSKHWYQINSGTVRLVTLLADGRRHIGNFCYAGDCFGFEVGNIRTFSAEAVEDCIIYRYPRPSLGRLIAEFPQVAQQLWNLTLRDLAHAQSQTAILARMTAPMRIASFLLDHSARHGSSTLLDLSMSRADVADYLGLTVETVCRVLSRFTELKLIAIPTVNQIEVIDMHAVETIFLEGFDPELGHYYGRRRTRSGRRTSNEKTSSGIPALPSDAFKSQMPSSRAVGRA
jgi:CRP/FNR family transcriptional regulator, nitrogen fixation regulation protein